MAAISTMMFCARRARCLIASMRIKTTALRCFALIAFFGVMTPALARDDLPLNDIPKELKPPTIDRDYTRRVEMIPMRDGVKLHTVVIVPKGAARAPILLTRTPYNATELTSHAQSSAERCPTTTL